MGENESVSSDGDIVYSLTKEHFKQRTFAEQLQLVLNGKPQPDLSSLRTEHKEKSRTYARNFNSANNYKKYVWLTGSNFLNKLFCWPCLLFSTDYSSCWTNTGFNSLNYLITACNKHQTSVNHIRAFTSLQTFIATHRIALDLQRGGYDSISNEEEKENRAILKRLIDVVIFFGKQEYLFFGGHDESDVSSNKGMYVELLHFLSDYDYIMANYLKTTTTVFRGKSPSIQNDLIASVGSVIYDQIKLEISETPFVAILLDETTAVSNTSQLSTTVRYVDKHGVCHERFLHVDVSKDRSAEGRFKIVKEIITELGCSEKVVADTYDGAAVMGPHIRGLQTLIKTEYPMATFVNSFAHSLDLVISQCTLHIKACQRFFITLQALSPFFSHSNTTNALQTFMDKKHPGVSPNRWNFTSRLVNTVRDYRSQLIDFFLTIEEEPGDWTSDEVIKAVGFIRFLSKVETKFLLNVFNCIFLVSNNLSGILQRKSLDLLICTQKVDDFHVFLQKRRDLGFDKVWEESSTVEDENVSVVRELSSRNEIASSDKETYSQLYYEVLDTLMYQIKFRFESQSQIQFIKLLDSSSFFVFSKKFPEHLMSNLLEQVYSKHFDLVRLKNELKVFYCFNELKNKSVSELSSFMKTKNLDVVYEQVFKLTQLVLTFPSTIGSSEKSFSALKRMKDYLRPKQCRSRQSNMAIISIEKNLLLKMKIQEEFYSNVTENITKKVRRRV